MTAGAAGRLSPRLRLAAAACALLLSSVGCASSNQRLARIADAAAPVPAVALVFTGGPALGSAAVLDLLQERDIRAMFCLAGRNVTKSSGIVARMARAGHTVGSNTYSRPPWSSLPQSRMIEEEFGATDEAIYKACGQEVRFVVLPPDWPVVAVRGVCRRNGYTVIRPNVRIAAVAGVPPEQVVQEAVRKMKPGFVVEIDEDVPATSSVLTEPARTAHLTRLLLDQLRARGLSIGPLPAVLAQRGSR